MRPWLSDVAVCRILYAHNKSMLLIFYAQSRKQPTSVLVKGRQAEERSMYCSQYCIGWLDQHDCLMLLHG